MELYKNTVLTIIAMSLAWIAARDFVPQANASKHETLMRVMICDDTGRCAKIDPAYDAVQVKIEPDQNGM